MADSGIELTRDACINVKEGLSRVRDNKKLYKRMLGMFLDNGEFTALEEYLAQKDFEKAADSAHAIKGMTGNLSLTAVFDMSTQMMTDLRHGITSDESEAAFREAYAKTRAYVEEVIAEIGD